MPAPDPADHRRLSRALAGARDLIERLRAQSAHVPPTPTPISPGVPFVMFMHSGLGGLALSGDEAEHYGRVLDAIDDIQGAPAEGRVRSRSASEDLLNRTIVRVLRPRTEGERRNRTPAYQRRLSAELRELRRALTSPLKNWVVVTSVGGFSAGTLPLTFGRVRFTAGSQAESDAVARLVPNMKPKRRVASSRIAAENESRAGIRAQVAAALAKGTIAVIEVLAFDAKAAEPLGIERIRRTLDVINFFARIVSDHPRANHHAYLLSEGPSSGTVSIIARPPDEARVSQAVEPSPIRFLMQNEEKATKLGVEQAHTLLAAAHPTDLQLRIANALSWAGRANVQRRREEAFLFLAIALEALLTNPKARTAVTERLSMRCAYLLADDRETRRRIHKRVGELYRARSGIVHTGDSTAVTSRDFDDLRDITEWCIRAALTHGPFPAMTSAASFEARLDDEAFGTLQQTPKAV